MIALATAWPGAPAAEARAAKAPDLAVVSVVPTKAKAEAGWGLELRAEVRNAGDGTTDFGTVAFALSKDRKPGRDLKLPPEVPVIPLQAGKGTALIPTLDVPAKTPPGRYYVVACATTPKGGSKANDCSVSKKQVQVLPAVQGTLTGDLSFVRGFQDGGSDWTESSTDQVSVSVKVRVDGRKFGWGVFANDGSTWSYVGTYDKVTHPSRCEVVTTGTSNGSGVLRQTGDQYEDDLLGSFALENHSEISLLLGFRYERTVRTISTPTEELGCTPDDVTEGPTQMRSLVDLDLKKIQQTKKAIVYRVAAARDPYSNDSEWDVTGKLTFELK